MSISGKVEFVKVTGILEGISGYQSVGDDPIRDIVIDGKQLRGVRIAHEVYEEIEKGDLVDLYFVTPATVDGKHTKKPTFLFCAQKDGGNFVRSNPSKAATVLVIRTLIYACAVFIASCVLGFFPVVFLFNILLGDSTSSGEIVGMGVMGTMVLSVLLTVVYLFKTAGFGGKLVSMINNQNDWKPVGPEYISSKYSKLYTGSTSA